jgi:predicted RNA-binding Zn-ribbon protein involved in translation (DUF1610 family)
VLSRFERSKNGDLKMHGHDQELLDKQKPIPFSCPLCEAEYKIVTIDTCDAQYGKNSCMKCGFPFPASEGRVAFKYFLVGRSSGRNRKWATLRQAS